MPIDDEQQAKLNDWLNTKGVKTRCPMCDGSQWEFNEMIFGNTVDRHGNIEVGGTTIQPLVQVLCLNCLYVMLWAAGPIGLIDKGGAGTP